jgi:hypothetical protein
MLRLPRLLQPFKKLPAKFVPTFPITVPSAEAATLLPNSPKLISMNLSLTSSSVISPFFVSIFSPPSTLDWVSWESPLVPNLTSWVNIIGRKSSDANNENFIFVIIAI